MNNADFLAAIAGVLLTLVFSYVPGISDKYAALDETYKRLIMLILLALAAGGAMALACAGLGPDFNLPFTCDRAGAVELVRSFVFAVMANQSFYKLTKRSGG